MSVALLKAKLLIKYQHISYEFSVMTLYTMYKFLEQIQKRFFIQSLFKAPHPMLEMNCLY